MNICIFEDEKVNNFYPLTLTRPIWDLRCGIFSLAEKIIRQQPRANYQYQARKYLRPLLKKQGLAVYQARPRNQETVFINARVVANESFIKKITNAKTNTLFYINKELAAAYVNNEPASVSVSPEGWLSFAQKHFKKELIKAEIIDYIWSLVNLNEDQITSDAQNFKLGKTAGVVDQGAHLINTKRIFIGQRSIIKPGVVIDASQGPVVIAENCQVLPNSVIIGPVYIGEGSTVKAGAKIYGGTSIGPVCKVGGEIEESIIQGFSNKQHDGFLGHAYIGEWCNLGADTNNSDLKNNYSSVDVFMKDGQKVDTGATFVGLFMGDHSKTGINTMFNTGTTIGFCCNVFGSGYLPKYIPSFAWLDAQKGLQKYDLKKALETAKKVTQRRKIKFTKNDEKIFTYLYEESN